MRIRRWLIVLIGLGLCALALAVVGAHAVSSRSGSQRSSPSAYAPASGGRISAAYMFDLTDKRQLVGWADDVFVGRVIEQSSSGFVPSAGEKLMASQMPYTLFRVEVLESLKGSLSGVVELRQDGDATTLLESDPQLKAGEVCLFVTHGSYDPKATQTGDQPAPGRPRVINGFGDVRVPEATARGAVVAEFRDAVENQIPFGQQ